MHKGFAGRMSYINDAGSRMAQKGGKTYLTPMKHISVPNQVIGEVQETPVKDSTGPAMSVQSMRATQKGG